MREGKTANSTKLQQTNGWDKDANWVEVQYFFSNEAYIFKKTIMKPNPKKEKEKKKQPSVAISLSVYAVQAPP